MGSLRIMNTPKIKSVVLVQHIIIPGASLHADGTLSEAKYPNRKLNIWVEGALLFIEMYNKVNGEEVRVLAATPLTNVKCILYE